MSQGSILFVHGTGVRLKSFQQTYLAARKRAAVAGLTLTFVDCAWGDALGIEPPVLALPGPTDPERARRAAEAEHEWAYLNCDPLFELRLLTIRDTTKTVTPLGRKPSHELLWNTIEAYQPSLELKMLLQRVDAWEQWSGAWQAIIQSPVAKQAVYASGQATADAAMALARALFAELNQRVQFDGLPALGAGYRQPVIERLRVDWGFQVFALSSLLRRFFTALLQERRRAWGEPVWPVIGDVLLYQANGHRIAAFIREKLAQLDTPVYLLAHSLGGIACVDLLATARPQNVVGLITAGSQAPLLYELGALRSLRRGEPLPEDFPRWINLYDPNDVLSYVGAKLFPGRVRDIEILSGELPTAAHSAYWNSSEAWAAIKDFVTA